MGVLKPLPVTITNYDGPGEMLEAAWHPQNESLGKRQLTFSQRLYIEQDDFSIDPPKGFKRLSPGGMVRLRYGFIIECEEVVSDDSGSVVELRCRYFPDSRSGSDTSGLKPKGVIHWVDAATAAPVEVRLYQQLFSDPVPDLSDVGAALNPDSEETLSAFVEAAVAAADMDAFQFERQGYFCRDSELADTFNRTVSLRDSYKPG